MPKQIALLLSCGLVVAACGSSANNGDSPKNPRQAYSESLAFSKCMREHGVSNFPDPTSGPGGGVQLSVGSSSGVNPRTPAFQAAQTSCKHLLPFGGPSTAHSAQAHAQLLQVSECMRAHGISAFPDPSSGTPPSSGASIVTGRGGWFLVIPSSIDANSPAFKQAATACKFGPRGARGLGGG